MIWKKKIYGSADWPRQGRSSPTLDLVRPPARSIGRWLELVQPEGISWIKPGIKCIPIYRGLFHAINAAWKFSLLRLASLRQPLPKRKPAVSVNVAAAWKEIPVKADGQWAIDHW